MELKTVTIRGVRWYIDERLKELRAVDNPHRVRALCVDDVRQYAMKARSEARAEARQPRIMRAFWRADQ